MLMLATRRTWLRGAPCAACLLAVGAPFAALGQSASVTRYLQITEERPTETRGAFQTKSTAGAVPLRGVEIDSILRLQWDESGLLSHLAGLVAPITKSDLQAQGLGIEDLATAARLLVQAQSHELRLRSAELAAMDPSKGAFQAQGLGAVAQFRAEAIADLTQQKAVPGPAQRDLASALSGDPNDGFASLRVACGEIVRGVQTRIEERVTGAPTVHLYLSAHLITPFGRPTQIHLEGYDRLEGGQPRPFARNRLVLDERTREELLAAQQILAALRQYRDVDLVRTARECNAAVNTAFASLKQRLRVSELDQELDKLAEALRNAGEEGVGPILHDVRALQALVRPLSRHPILTAPDEARGLVQFANLVSGLSADVWTFVRSAPHLLDTVAQGVGAVATASPGVVGEDTVRFFAEIRESFVGNFASISADAERATATLNATSRALLLTEDFTLVAQDLVGKAVGGGDPLDTALDMRTIPAERRPGDRVVVRAQVRRAEPSAAKSHEPTEEVVLDEGSVSLVVEAFGGYWQSGGSLLFVDPRSRIDRSLNYEPTVGLGLHYHYGMRGASYWNRVLNPGLGVSFSMLDFNDDRRFEVGAALGVTLFNDQLWLGYGRNLNAGGDYFYLGFNPFSLSRLLRGGR